MPPTLQAKAKEVDLSDVGSDDGSSSVEVLAHITRMSATLKLVTARLTAGTSETGGQRQLEPGLYPRLKVPVYTGLDDHKCVSDFPDELDVHARASGALEAYMLERTLALALQASARRRWALQAPFPSVDAFRRRFRDGFVPSGYESGVLRELERRTQHPEEGFVCYIRVMQQLLNRAAQAAPE